MGRKSMVSRSKANAKMWRDHLKRRVLQAAADMASRKSRDAPDLKRMNRSGPPVR